MTTAEKIIRSTGNPYRYKDAKKFANITKLIARGYEGSSSDAYCRVLNDICNTGVYESHDIVGISVNGGHNGKRLPFNQDEVAKACEAGATIITDDISNRGRAYNVGEREVEAFLRKHDYQEVNFSGVWKSSLFWPAQV